MIRKAIEADKLHLSTSLGLTMLIESAEAFIVMEQAIPHYERTPDLEHAIERGRMNLEWLAQHGLIVEDSTEPAGVRPQHNPDSLIEVLAGMTAASAYLGERLALTGIEEFGVIVSNLDTNATIILTWIEVVRCSAQLIGDLLSAEFRPEAFEPRRAGNIRQRLQALDSERQTTGSIERLDADDFDRLDAEHAEREAVRRDEQQVAAQWERIRREVMNGDAEQPPEKS